MRSELLIGRILRPRGLKGELKAEVYSSDPHWLLGYAGSVIIDGKAYRVQKFAHEGAFGYIQLDGVTTVEEAEALRDKDVYARRDELPKNKDGEYFIVDILGLDVIVGGDNIGTVVDVAQYGSADVYTVKTKDGLLSFPALKTLIKSIDLEAGKMTLDATIFERVVVRG